MAKSRIDSLIPLRMHAGDSVRILLSLHPPPDEALIASRVVLPMEDLVSEGVAVSVVDADIHEIEKALRRAGQHLSIHGNVLRIAFDDCYHTFPLIQHDGPDGAIATLVAIENLLLSWNRSEHDRVVAFSLGVVSAERELRIAMLGHVVDLVKHIHRIRLLFDCKDDEAIARWTDEVAESLGTNSSERDGSDIPRGDDNDHLMTPYRTFRISRKAISPDQLVFEVVDGRPRYTLRIPVSDHELLAAIEAGHLCPAFAWVVRRSECTRCGAQYFECSCSRYLDSDVNQELTEAEIAYPFWTDRPA